MPKREERRIHGVPVAVDDARPVLCAQVVSNVHVGNRVAVDLVVVLERVAKSRQRSKRAVEREEATKQAAYR